MKLEIAQFNDVISILENDIRVYKENLKHHVPNIETLAQEIYSYQENLLKKTFESATVKASKAKPKQFTINSHLTKNKSTPKNSSKQFSSQTESHKDKKVSKPKSTIKLPNFHQENKLNMSRSITNNNGIERQIHSTGNLFQPPIFQNTNYLNQ